MAIKSISAPGTGTEQLLIWSRRVGVGVLVIGVAYALTQSGRLFSGSAVAPIAEGPTEGGRVAQLPEETDENAGQQASRLNPFGAPSVIPTQEGIAAPAAKPSLELVGILSVGEQHGLVLIATDNGKETVFSVGDTLPGGAILKSVYLDRVLLDGERGVETLWLPKNRHADAGGSPIEPLNHVDDQPDMPQSLVDYRDRFLSAPGENTSATESFQTSDLAQFFTPATTETGELMGFRLSSGSREPAYEQLGLQPGDVILTVNGIPLTQPENSVRGLRRLKSDGLASITFIRDGNKIVDITLMRDKQPNAQ